jgi:glycosyltransferase involved in cell wall biosynthesis
MIKPDLPMLKEKVSSTNNPLADGIAGKKIRVLYIVDHLGRGGAQEIVFQLCKSIDRERFIPSVLVLYPGGAYLQKLMFLGVPIHFLIPSRNILLIPRLIFRLLNFLQKRDFDLVHIFLSGSFALAVPVAKLKGLPIVHSVLSVRSQPPNWYYLLMALYQSMVSVYLGLEETELRQVGIKYQKIKMTEVLIDLNETFNLVHDQNMQIPNVDLNKGDLVVLSAGRLHPDKGHDYAIRAWPSVLHEYPSAKLLIAGTGTEEGNLRNLIQKLNLSNSVFLVGYRQDLICIFSRTDIFLRTSVNEGTNLVTFMAMSAQLPIIAFSTRVPKDYVIHDYTGWVIPLDEGALGNAIIHLAGDPNLRDRLGMQARISLKAYYNSAMVISYHQELYSAIYKKKAPEFLPTMRERMWPCYNPFKPSVYHPKNLG